MRIVWVTIAVAALAAAYALGRFQAGSDRSVGPPPKMPPVVLAPGDAEPENVEYITALHAALDEPTLLARTSRTARLLEQLTPANAQDAARAVWSSGPSPLRELVLDGWAGFDGWAAFEYVQDLNEFSRKTSLPSLLESWATVDPMAARAAYETLEAEDKSNPRAGTRGQPKSALTGLAKGWARSGQPGLMRFLAAQDGSQVRQEVIEFAIGLRRARDGNEALMEWADRLSESDDMPPPFKRTVLNRTAAVLSRRDPVAASAWAAQYAETDSALRVLNGVTNGWVLRDGDAALRWLASLPANEARDEVVEQAYSFWLKQRREDAMEWMAQAETQRAWEPAIGLYAEALAETDPTTALEFAERITRIDLRTSSLIRVSQIWYASEPGPATAWLEQSPLTAEQRASAVNPPKKRRRPGLAPGERAGRVR